MRYTIDLETACSHPGCSYHGQAMCANKHSLSPWHSKITVIGVESDRGTRCFRGDRAHFDLMTHLEEDSSYEVEGHSFKFDYLHLAARGAVIPLEKWVDCTALMAYVLTDKIPDSYITDLKLRAPKGQHRFGKHSLKTLAPYFLGIDPFWEVEDKDNDEYVLKDVSYTRSLRPILESKLKDLGEYDFYRDRQLEWTKMLAEAELRGVEIDLADLDAKEDELKYRAAMLKEKLDEMWNDAHKAYRSLLKEEIRNRYESMAAKANKPFNYGSRYWKLYESAREKLPSGVDYDSPKQMAWLLKDYKGYSITSLEGDESTGREVLERLAEEGHEDVRTYLEWRKTNKLLTAFIPTYKELQVDGTIHPIFNPDSTRTGRTSSERPNMQQVPPSLRPLFKPRPGFKFIGYDAAAIEAKLIALYSEDPTLYEIIHNGVSIHDHNTKVFFNLPDVPYENIKKEYANERSASKNVGFALFYNAGANRIRIAFAQKGYHLSETECRELHKRFKNSYSTAMKYSQEIVRHMEKGNTLQNLLGRPLKIQDPNDAYMKSFNTLIQSSASDYLLHGAMRARQAFKQNKITAYPVLFVHDFVCFEVEESRVNEADELLQNALTDFQLANSLGEIKLEVDGGIMDRWEK